MRLGLEAGDVDHSAQRRLDKSAALEHQEAVAATLVQAGRAARPRIVLLSGRPADELECLAINEGHDLVVDRPCRAPGAGSSMEL